ncbi:MoxR family ATPase [Pontiellaceae bacterium B1224]|nr:MoxR family ATPase [Pontiellaceae bacterium B1224]
MAYTIEQFQETLTKAKREIAKVVIGQDAVIDKAMIAIITRNHALIEGVPGVAKTLLVRTLAKVLGCDFGRIQFTPDLMPADITGTNIFNMKNNEFNLVKGPVFTTFLLADEINRAPAKTQSALLQAMQERCVSIDCETHPLSEDFTVFATQNPLEYEGTYPLPEAQKDRFMLKITMDCLGPEEEIELARRSLGNDAPEKVLEADAVQTVIPAEELGSLREVLLHVTVRDELIDYVVGIIRATRTDDSTMVGAGPRATQALMLAARAHAIIQGRDFVTPDDIKIMANPVLCLRIILQPEYEIEGMTVSEVIERILQEIPVPR